jgi:uncharacterized protein
MNADEKQLLTALFERIRTASAAPRDAEAEAFIATALHEQPYAPYILAQAVIVQEQALKMADAKLHELETKLAAAEQQKSQETSFLGGIGASLFGGAKTASGVPATGPAPQPQAAPNPWGQARPAPGPAYTPAPGYAPTPGYAPAPGYPAPAGGSFLSSALSTAAGVAGGALLFEGVSSLFRGGMGYGSAFGGGGFGNAGFGGQPVVNETVYETVNVYDQQSQAAPSAPSWSQADSSSASDDATFADNSDFGGSDFGGGDFGGGDSGGDDWA